MEQVIETEYTEVPTMELVPTRDERIAAWRQEIGRLLEYAKAAEVTDLDSAKRVANDLTVIKSLKDTLKETHDFYKAPYLKHGREIDQLFNILAEPLDEAKGIYGHKMATYHKEQERQRKEAEAINKTVGTPVLEVPDPQKHVRAEAGTVTFIKRVDKEKVQAAIDGGVREIRGLHIYPVWTFSVENKDIVPDEYLMTTTRTNGVRS